MPAVCIDDLLRYLVPLLLRDRDELVSCHWAPFSHSHLQVVPQTFDHIEVKGVLRPICDEFDLLIFKVLAWVTIFFRAPSISIECGARSEAKEKRLVADT